MSNELTPFDHALAKAGAPVITRNGRPYTYGGYNPHAETFQKVCGWIGNIAHTHGEDGRFSEDGSEHELDLFMAPKPKVKKSGWINVYPPKSLASMACFSPAYITKQIADESAAPDRIDCIYIEWEEPAP